MNTFIEHAKQTAKCKLTSGLQLPHEPLAELEQAPPLGLRLEEVDLLVDFLSSAVVAFAQIIV